jgi:hypothetical protein
MYAPTEDKADSEKEDFYEKLQLVIDQIPNSDTILVIGDANAKLGKEDIYNEVSEKHTLHELSNGTGEMLLEFAIGKNLTVMSTQFQHKRIYKGTWLAPDQMTLNQTDHFMINSKKKDVIENVISLRGTNTDSEHYLLEIIMSQTILKIYTKKNTVQTELWNKSNLTNPTKPLDYRRALSAKLKNQTQYQDVEQEWIQIKRAITEAVYETIQTQCTKQKNEWWDNDCQLAIREKNEARRIWLQHRTRASNAWYHKKRNEANRM